MITPRLYIGMSAKYLMVTESRQGNVGQPTSNMSAM